MYIHDAQIHKYTHTHTHTHARMHTRKHACTCTLTHAHRHARTHAHTHTRTHTHTHTHTLTLLVDEDTFTPSTSHALVKDRGDIFLIVMSQKCCFEYKKELQCSSHLQPYILRMYSCILSSLSILPGPILIPHNVPSTQCTVTSDEWPQQIDKHGLLYRGSVSLMSVQNYGHYR